MKKSINKREVSKNGYKLYLWLNKNENKTIEEMKEQFGFKSMTSVQRALVSLEKLGLVKREKYQHRSWTVIKQDFIICPCCGNLKDLRNDTVRNLIYNPHQ